MKEFRNLADKHRAEHATRFFKTAPGEYGHGDYFLGISNPKIRTFAKGVLDITFNQLEALIQSKWHEERFLALVILEENYRRHKRKQPQICTQIYRFYVKHMKWVNNWDLVDASAPGIVGRELLDKDREKLYQWVKSKHLWTRRISIISTLHFIRNHDFKDTLQLSKLLLQDQHDLIHKAVGWMLREVGKKDGQVLDQFLRENYQMMPRTMLRYAIEKYPESIRKKILLGQY